MVGCTLAPDKILWLDLKPYCDIHDEHYDNHNVTRAEADLQFFHNIKSEGGVLAYIIAIIYYHGVRFFGWISWYKLLRWLKWRK